MRHVLFFVALCTATASYSRNGIAQLSPSDHKELGKQMAEIMSRKDLTNDEKGAKMKELQDKAVEKARAKAEKESGPPKFDCGNTGVKGPTKYKIMTTAELSESLPGRFVWGEVVRFKDAGKVHRDFLGNLQCGLGYTTKSKNVQAVFGVGEPGFYVLSLHVDADNDGKQSAAGDFHGYTGGTPASPSTALEAAKTIEVTASTREIKGITFGIGRGASDKK